MSIPTTLSARIRDLAYRAFKAAHWCLVTPEDDEFVEMVAERLAVTAPDAVDHADKAIVRVVKFTFSALLYQAFGRDGSPEQECAYQAAHAYLYPRLLYRLDGDEAQATDLTHETLAAVWETVGRRPIKEPGTFLDYLLQSALHRLYRFYRDKAKWPRARHGGDDASDGPEAGEPPPTGKVTLLRAVEDDVEHRMLLANLPEIARRCLEGQHLRIVEEHFFNGRSFKDLAREWGCTANKLYLDKFRALAKLRVCPEWLRLVGDPPMQSGAMA